MTPTTEKAAPIPADVLALARLASIEIGEWVVDRSRKHPRDIVADLLLANRASQEERIREDERARCARQLHQLASLEKERAEEAPPGERRKAARWAAAKLCMAAGQIAPDRGAS